MNGEKIAQISEPIKQQERKIRELGVKLAMKYNPKDIFDAHPTCTIRNRMANDRNHGSEHSFQPLDMFFYFCGADGCSLLQLLHSVPALSILKRYLVPYRLTGGSDYSPDPRDLPSILDLSAKSIGQLKKLFCPMKVTGDAFRRSMRPQLLRGFALTMADDGMALHCP